MPELKRLSDELISQIAAGEVVERPASVLKELIDNSIDAGATQIKVKLKDGGLKLVEVSDNGSGMPKENLLKAFEPHTTSKISNLKDLSDIRTMGFRGEALATILSVAQVEVTSGHDKSAYSIVFSQERTPKKAARNIGTTVSVANLFFNTPARLKFMKTAETEYRKILEVFNSYALAYPKIHFILEKDQKEVFNLPSRNEVNLDKNRVFEVLKKAFVERMIPIKSEGAGIKIIGLIGHPSDSAVKQNEQYVFVNNRPIWDNGISRAIHQGLSRFIPHMFKVPFIIKLFVKADLVDVNVHPRKEEVKFINPFRVYIAIEQAVKQTVEQATQMAYTPPSSFKQSQPTKGYLFDNTEITYTKQNDVKEVRFGKKTSDFNISRSIDFTKHILRAEDTQTFKSEPFKAVYQLFNKYIVIEFESGIWLIDQHAAAERITFERLEKQYQSKKKEIQKLLVPTTIEISDAESSYLKENQQFYEDLGFELKINENVLEIYSIPSFLMVGGVEEVFKSLFDIKDGVTDLKDNYEKKWEIFLLLLPATVVLELVRGFLHLNLSTFIKN